MHEILYVFICPLFVVDNEQHKAAPAAYDVTIFVHVAYHKINYQKYIATTAWWSRSDGTTVSVDVAAACVDVKMDDFIRTSSAVMNANAIAMQLCSDASTIFLPICISK